MTIIGYARVSTTDQNLEIQETALRAGGCEVIRRRLRRAVAVSQLCLAFAGDQHCVRTYAIAPDVIPRFHTVRGISHLREAWVRSEIRLT
jgi:hypothetical protein